MTKYIDGVKKIKRKISPVKKESVDKKQKISGTRRQLVDGIGRLKKKMVKSDNKEIKEEFQEVKIKEKEESPLTFDAGSWFDFSKVARQAEKIIAKKQRKAEEKITKKQKREEQKRAKLLSKQQQKEQEEQERLKKITEERKYRRERQQKLAREAKKRKEKIKKAKAKLKAEKLALKLKKKEETKKKTEEYKRMREIKKQELLALKVKKKRERAKKIWHLIYGFKHQSKKIAVALLVVVVVFMIAITVLSYAFYGLRIQNNFVQVLVQKLPFPVMIINYHPITYSNYVNEQRLLGDYYLAQSSIGEQDDEIQVDKNTLVREEIIKKSILESLAQKYNIKVNSQDTEQVFQRLAEQQDGVDNFVDKIYNDYGLTRNIFVAKVIYYIALKEKLQEKFIADNDLHKGANLRMEKVLKLLKKDKDKFEEYAEKYSEDVHALKGGDIGYVKVDSIDDKLKQAIHGLETGDISEVIKEEGKYYLVKIYDIKDGRQGQEIWLKQITIFTNYSFAKYLEELREQARVWVLIQS